MCINNTPVVRVCVCTDPKPVMKNSENGISTYCKTCSKTYKQINYGEDKR